MAHRTILALFLLLTGAILGACPGEAQIASHPPKFSSAYTDLARDCINALKTVGEGQDMPLKCKGYGNYYVYIYYSALASHIGIKTVKGDDFIYLSPEKLDFSDKKDNKLEWRLANGKPFAVILKVARYNDAVQESGENPYEDKYKIGDVVLVKGLKGYGTIDFQVDPGSAPEAMRQARERADSAYLKLRP
jgi:hypothetical protein